MQNFDFEDVHAGYCQHADMNVNRLAIQAVFSDPMNKPLSLKERAIAARERRNLTQEAAASRIGCSRATVAMWEADGTRSISSKYLMQAAAVYQVRPEWLTLKVDADGYPWVNLRPIKPFDSNADLSDDYVVLPRIEYYLSAGNGGPDPAVAEALETGAAFRADFIKRQGWSRETHFTMRADGESMEPTIQDSAPVVIATNEKTIRSGRVYALLLDGEPLLKRLEKRPGGKVLIKSDNPMPQYADYEADEAQIKIIGRAVWTPVLL